jgi:CpeS-like protein
MDIIEFFQLSVGKWAALKSSHDLTSGEQVASKATLYFDALDQTAADVVQLCQQHDLDPSLVAAGWRLSWEDVTDLSQKKQGSGLLIVMADPAATGTFLQLTGTTTLAGHYRLTDDKLSLFADGPDLHTEEHIWYESDNVRLRSSIVKNDQGAGVASFYSEVRLISTPKPAEG